MTQEEKARSFGEWLFRILAIVLIPLICWVVYDTAGDLADRLKGDGVRIQATITSVDHYTELDEGFEEDHYKSYVSYEYDGQSYSHVYYSDSRSKPKLGKTVSVLISPDNPGELLVDGANYYLSFILPPLFLAAAVAVVNLWLRDRLKTQALKKDPEQDPVWLHKKSNRNSLGILGLLMALASLAFYQSKQSLVFSCFCIAALALVAYCTMRKPKPKAAAEQ